MRSARKLVVPIVCLGLVIGAPAAYAQPIPRVLIRLCLRNLLTGLACYIVGRGGELLVDGSLSAAWAKAKETVAGEAPEGDDKTKPKAKPGQPTPAQPLLPSLTNPIIEPIRPSELSSLSKRLPGGLKHAPNTALKEGFFIYEAPKTKTTPPGPKSVVGGTAAPKAPLPTSSLSDLIKSGTLSSKPVHEPLWLKLVAPNAGKPAPGPDAYRARNADKLVPPLTSLSANRFATLQSDCQRKRERETGLSLLAILGAPDFDAKVKRRMEEVVKPCMKPRPF